MSTTDPSELKTILETLLGDEPDQKIKVYFQPPSNVQMVYPCILFKRDGAVTRFAGNLPYRYTKRYLVTYISRDPKSEVPDKIAALPLCTFDRHYAADDLNHDVFRLFF